MTTEASTSAGTVTERPAHLFESESGDLYDTRKPDWARRPLREGFSRTYREVKNGRELRASMRAGKWSFPGGYEIYGIASDGEVLCMDCISSNYKQVVRAIRDTPCHPFDEWRVIGFESAGNTDSHTECSHCGRVIVEEEEEDE